MEEQLTHFLLVEDDDDHAEIILRTLEEKSASTTVMRVQDGRQALDYLNKVGSYKNTNMPDLVILDLKLPKLNGHEVLSRIKRDPELADIPVVVMSTSDSAHDRREAYRRYANSYLVKPANFQRFRTMIEDLSVYWGQWNWSTRK